MGGKKQKGFNTPFEKIQEALKAKRKAHRSASTNHSAAEEPKRRPAPIAASQPSNRENMEPPPREDSLCRPDHLEEDEALLESWFHDVERLPDHQRGRVPTARRNQPPPNTTSTDEDAEVLAALSDLVAGEGDFDVFDTDEYVEGIAPGVDRRLLKRLRRGEFSVQAHLDLHGMVKDEARTAVAAFIRASRQAGRRCVIIVHGRGLRSPGKEPVLKKALVRWLCRGQVGQQVLAFTTTLPHDGGGGAVYVLLRR